MVEAFLLARVRWSVLFCASKGVRKLHRNLAKASAKHLDTKINRSNLRVLKKKGVRKNSENFFRDPNTTKSLNLNG